MSRNSRQCLQCGETKESLRQNKIILCGIMSGGETPELVEEFPTHHWADWTDRELASFGVKPESFGKHRRTDVLIFQWIACEDLIRGHAPAKPEDVPDWAGYVGQCILCGRDSAPLGSVWRDRQDDLWTLGADDLLHSPETRPFSRKHVEKKWGPLVPVARDSGVPQ